MGDRAGEKLQLAREEVKMARTRLSSTSQREGQKPERASSSARSLSPVQPSRYEEMLALQGAVGNQAVGQLLGKKNLPQRESRSRFRGLSYELMTSQRAQIEPPLMTKPSNEQPGDKYEQKGEKVAAEVVDRNSSTVQRLQSQDAGGSETRGDRLGASGRRQTNNTGLPNNLKAGIENLSGYSMDDVKVHYNSSKPAQLQALAYTQGTEIYVGPGQERHLPHEAWHVVQQKQGRVKPTLRSRGVTINDDHRLEREADQMGDRAAWRGLGYGVATGNHSIRLGSTEGSSRQLRALMGSSTVVQCTVMSTAKSRSRHASGPNNTYNRVNQKMGCGHMDVRLQMGTGPTGTPPEASALKSIMTHLTTKYPNGNWRKGHFLNQNLGGKGKAINMAPITQSANSQMTYVENRLNSLFPEDPESTGLLKGAPDLINLLFDYNVDVTNYIDENNVDGYGLKDPKLKGLPSELTMKVTDATAGGYSNLDWKHYTGYKKKAEELITQSPFLIDNTAFL